FVRIYGRTASARRFAALGIASGILACGAFVGVALTPENLAFDLHVTMTNLAFRLLPISTLLFAIASTQSDSADWFTSGVWFGLTAILIAFAITTTWGPSFVTPGGSMFQVIAQKVTTLAILGAAVLLSARTNKLVGVGPL